MSSFTSDLTGGLIDTGAPNYAGIAKRNEARRRGLIDLGMQQINAVFGGGSAPFYSLAAPNEFSKGEWKDYGKEQTFFSVNKKGNFAPYYAPKRSENSAAQTGNVFGGGVGGAIAGLSTGDIKGATQSAMFGLPGQLGLMGGLFGGDQPTVREIVNKRLRKGLLFKPPEVKTFEGYQPEFFNERARAYERFALPQVEDQYRATRDAVTFGLANRGLGRSSVGDTARGNVERTAGKARQQVVDTGIAQANKLRGDVESARQEAIRTLYETSNPAQALQSAVAAATQFEQPPVFAPIANAFGNVAEQYYISQLLNNYKQQQGQAAGGYNPTYSLSKPVTGPITY